MTSRLKKIRADRLLVEQGLTGSREQGARLIMAGQVLRILENLETEAVDKPGRMLPVETRLEIKKGDRFVSRGGEKLLTGLDHFSIEVDGLVALDCGASTGGFTDCLLQKGARRIYALDVGYGQLHWKLRTDARVINLERVNIRYAPRDLIPEAVDLAVVDCSFISLELVLPACLKYLKSCGQLLALIKPQFELDRGRTRKGVVRSKQLQQEAVDKVLAFARQRLGLRERGTVPSRIKGPKGNQEFLVLFSRGEEGDLFPPGKENR
ncbi:MAG: TlyA family RNA methyltransferase [Desulfohalobiaceae bacterium]|nr:TlyA family RNA methyltransferase [Desulfohalobiaceae bacterium]